MNTMLLSDKDQYPTEETIFTHIGDARKLWTAIFDYIHLEYPDLSEEWRYYNDGKSWLMKVTRKSKTIFWLSIIPDAFKITFYFGDKAEPAIQESSISKELKNAFTNGKRFGKIRAITSEIRTQVDLEHVITLIGVKLSVK